MPAKEMGVVGLATMGMNLARNLANHGVRAAAVEKLGMGFIGSGVSGGEEGALLGPSLMPGGTHQSYARVEDMWTAISAKVGGVPCCTYIGPDGAGHFVKMVHNGIEYADIQLIAESYDLMRDALGLSAD